jgi:hypothetical protein
MFRYTSWHFYAFSGNNLLTSRHSASSLFFCYFCVSEKLHKKYSRNWTKQVPEVLFFPEASRDPKRRRSGATRGPHTRAARPGPWPCPLCVRPPLSTPDDATSSIKTPRREKPKGPINFPETHRDPPPSSTRDREGPEALLGTWYISNVSIIFDAPCLFLHHLYNVSLHLVALLCIFRN